MQSKWVKSLEVAHDDTVVLLKCLMLVNDPLGHEEVRKMLKLASVKIVVEVLLAQAMLRSSIVWNCRSEKPFLSSSNPSSISILPYDTVIGRAYIATRCQLFSLNLRIS